jgi:two-component system NarL family response regulator
VPEQRTIRVLIVDNHPIVREGLRSVLDHVPDMELVGEAEGGAQAMEMYRLHLPDVVLMDLRMPDMDGAQATAAIRAEFPGARVIMLTAFGGDEEIYGALHAGVRAYLMKGAACSEILETIRVVHAGHKRITLSVGAQLADRMDNPELTDREKSVLRLMVAGRSNKEIGTALDIGIGTVKFHVSNILDKLGAADRTQAVIAALKRGMVNLD